MCFEVTRVLKRLFDPVYIDALNGEYVGRDIVMAETGFAVAIQESANSTAYLNEIRLSRRL